MSKLRRRSVVGAGVLGGIAASLGAPLVKRVEAADPRTLTVASTTDVDTLDPASFRTDGAYTVTTNVYDTSVGWEVAPSATVPGVSTAHPSSSSEPRRVLRDRGRWRDHRAQDPARRQVPERSTDHGAEHQIHAGSRIAVSRLRAADDSALPARDVTGQFIVRDDYTFVMKMPGPTPPPTTSSRSDPVGVDEVIARRTRRERTRGRPTGPAAIPWAPAPTRSRRTSPASGSCWHTNRAPAPQPFHKLVNSWFVPNEATASCC